MPKGLTKQTAGKVADNLGELAEALPGVELTYFRESNLNGNTSLGKALHHLSETVEANRYRLEDDLGLNGLKLWKELRKKKHLATPVRQLEETRWSAMEKRYGGHPGENTSEFSAAFNRTYQNEMAYLMLVMVDRNVNPAKWRENAGVIFSSGEGTQTRSTKEKAKEFVSKNLGMDYRRVMLRRKPMAD